MSEDVQIQNLRQAVSNHSDITLSAEQWSTYAGLLNRYYSGTQAECGWDAVFLHALSDAGIEWELACKLADLKSYLPLHKLKEKSL